MQSCFSGLGALGLVLLVTSCAGEMPAGSGADAGAGRDGVGVDGGEGPDLQLAPLPQTTRWSTIPVHGSGPADGDVLIDTPAVGTLTVPIGPTGTFCADVPLLDDQANVFTLRAIDPRGAIGGAVQATVTQSGDPPLPPGGSPSQDVALGGGISGGGWGGGGSTGDLTRAIDGDRATAADIFVPHVDFSGEDWLWVQLIARAQLRALYVVGTAACPMASYKVLVSDLPAPGLPTTTPGDWTTYEPTVSGTITELALDPPVTARHMALWFTSKECRELLGSHHQVAALEAWTVADVPPPADAAPSCQNGG